MAAASPKVRETPLAAVLSCCAIGLFVMPVRPGTKVPLLDNWHEKSTKSPNEAQRMWQRWPNAGIGVHCGPSGLVVIDVDVRNGGLETLAKLEARYGPIWDHCPAIARTGGGGWHYVFLVPQGVRLPSKLGPGVDVLHGNRFFIVAPTTHPITGKAYKWERGFDPFSMKELPVLPACWAIPIDGTQPAVDVDGDALANLPPQPLADTAEERTRLRDALNFVSPDCPYPDWQRRVFAILASGLPDAVDIAREWSERAPDRFERRAFDTLVNSFKEERRRGGDLVGPGTLFHLAKQAGWKDPRAKAAEPDGLDKSFQLIPAHEFAHASPVSWLVRSLIQRDGLGVVYGEPGSGKSFLVLDLSAAVALGNEWRGLTVTGGPVVYVAAEGAGGFRKRLQALALHHGVDLESLPLWVVADAPNFLRDDDKALADAIQAAGGAALIVVDTLASVTPGGNENAAEDMGAVIARCKRLQAEVDGFVLLVHHSGKDASRGARGWSGLRGAVDLEIEITRNGEDRTAKVTKQKDGEDGESFPFRLKVVDLGSDGEGNPSTSCAVEHVDTAPPSARREPTGTVQLIVYRVVKDRRPCSVDELLKLAVDRMVHDPEKKDKRREHARRALENLLTGKFLTRRYDGAIMLYGEVSQDWPATPEGDEESSEGGI